MCVCVWVTCSRAIAQVACFSVVPQITTIEEHRPHNGNYGGVLEKGQFDHLVQGNSMRKFYHLKEGTIYDKVNIFYDTPTFYEYIHMNDNGKIISKLIFRQPS